MLVVQKELADINKVHTIDTSIIDEILTFTNSIVKKYNEADNDHKRAFLHFFFKEIFIKDKQISRITYTPALQVLNEARLGILVHNWLTTPPLTLYQIFNRETIAKVRIQLEVARKLASNPLAYEVVEVTNGRFCQLPVPA